MNSLLWQHCLLNQLGVLPSKLKCISVYKLAVYTGITLSHVQVPMAFLYLVLWHTSYLVTVLYSKTNSQWDNSPFTRIWPFLFLQMKLRINWAKSSPSLVILIVITRNWKKDNVLLFLCKKYNMPLHILLSCLRSYFDSDRSHNTTLANS